MRDHDSSKMRIRISGKMKLALQFDENEIDEGTICCVAVKLTVKASGPSVCYAVYANTQGPKNKLCPYFHTVGEDTHGKHGKIIQLECSVQFHIYIPVLHIDEVTNEVTSSTKYMAILCYGEHTHPPPAVIKLFRAKKEQIVDAIRKGNSNFQLELTQRW